MIEWFIGEVTLKISDRVVVFLFQTIGIGSVLPSEEAVAPPNRDNPGDEETSNKVYTTLVGTR